MKPGRVDAARWTDPIVAELHRVREAHAARFNEDLRAIVEDFKKLEGDWPAPTIDPAPKPPVSYRKTQAIL
jgi:hypothetical protein